MSQLLPKTALILFENTTLFPLEREKLLSKSYLFNFLERLTKGYEAIIYISLKNSCLEIF